MLHGATKKKKNGLNIIGYLSAILCSHEKLFSLKFSASISWKASRRPTSKSSRPSFRPRRRRSSPSGWSLSQPNRKKSANKTKKKVQVFRDLSKLSPGNEWTMEVGTQLALKVNKIRPLEDFYSFLIGYRIATIFNCMQSDVSLFMVFINCWSPQNNFNMTIYCGSRILLQSA